MAISNRLSRPLAAALLAASGAAWAALGEQSVPAGHAPGISSAALRTPSGAAYTRVQRMLPSEVTVSEYVDANGLVFAVAWSGPTLPDLASILGRHHAAFEQNAAAVGRKPSVSIKRPDVVIFSRGRMGAFQGHAWLPGSLPLGFDTRGLK